MRIAIPREPEGHALVAATPQTAALLIRLGHEVAIEEGAGARASFPDDAYLEQGASIVPESEVWNADMVLCVDAPSEERIASMHPGAILVSRLAPMRDPGLAERIAPTGITALAIDAVPRISRAQAMDVLSSQANVAGYRAVIEAASRFGRVFTGQVTAAGKMPPARVYVIGAGVAGLAAIGTANSMGARVYASDVRPEVGEQVESMGASFVPVPSLQEGSGDGYAKEMDADAAALATALYAEEAAKSDIVITTANIPGRRSPILLDEAAVAAMAPGSVIVDMAAANGGNCALTVPGEAITTGNGVTIIGYADLAERLPAQASQLYGRNLANLLALLTPDKDGRIDLDMNDEVIRGITVVAEGAIMWPPPPIAVSAAPAAQAPAPEASGEELAARARAKARARRKSAIARGIGLGLAALAFAALVLATPPAATGHYIVLILAVILGFYVISNVTPALHTPLMSVTNAISGIILVGAISQIGDPHPLIAGASFIAIVLACVNIFGGFTVTHRMLAMFRK